jgi:HAD superfamily phosphoserine phosphatase-like hydrolase
MKLVCFDFDDVIADSRSIVKLPFVGGKIKALELGPEFIEGSLDSKRFKKFMDDVVKEISGLHMDMVVRFMLHMKLHKGVKEVLEKLHKNYKIVIISTNDEGIIRKYLEKHRLDRYVDHIYAAKLETKEGIVTGKITGEVMKDEKVRIVPLLERKYGVKRKDITYIGDGPTDLPIMKKIGKGILFNPNVLTKAEVFASKELKAMENSGRLFLAEGNDLRKVLEFIN